MPHDTVVSNPALFDNSRAFSVSLLCQVGRSNFPVRLVEAELRPPRWPLAEAWEQKLHDTDYEEPRCVALPGLGDDGGFVIPPMNRWATMT